MFGFNITEICLVNLHDTVWLVSSEIEKKRNSPEASANNSNFIWHDLRNYFYPGELRAPVFPYQMQDERGPHLADGS